MQALLLEPDGDTRTQLSHALRERGWQVTLVHSDLEAMRRFREQTFPLVVVGCQAWDEPALTLCRDLRTVIAEHDAFLLAVIPAIDPDSVRRLAEAGVDDFLTRPLSSTQLRERILFTEGRISRSGGEPTGDAGSYPGRVAELEETLHVQQHLLEGLFQSAPEGIAVVDAHQRIVRVNDEFARMFGFSEEAVQGHRIDELIVPDQLSHEAESLTEGVRQGEHFVVETIRRHRNGTLIDVAVLATPIVIADALIGGYAIYRDISRQKAHERALVESEARYRALFDQSPVGVFLCDPELRVTHCNERLSEIVGVPYEEIVGTKLVDLHDERLLPGVSRARTGEPAFYEGPYRSLRGREIWVSVRYAPLQGSDGKVTGGMGVLEDVTSRQQAQQQLRAQAAELERVNAALHERTLELESALQARSRLYSSLNHELRTPISAILLYQELLMAGTLGPLGEEQQEAMERSHTAARHLLELVQDVLDLSKIEAGNVSVHPVEVELPVLLQDLRDTMLPVAQRYGSEILLQLEPAPRPLVTDPQRVRQVLLNLLSNAAKFGRGRPITVSCRTTPAEETWIEVIDQGVGIADADLSAIFEDFVQVGKSPEGTGLGLAISRRLAGLLKGRLEVESRLGQGSTFRLVLPSMCAAPDSPRDAEVV